MNKKLEVNQLQISFRTNNGNVRAVRDISFDLYEGETLAIVGESGSGKSVTARAIMGILAPNAIVEGGQILYDGRDLLAISEEEFHTLRGNKLAMIFQDPLSSLNPIVQVGRQLTEAMILNNRERRRSAKRNLKRMLKNIEDVIAQSEGSAKASAAREQVSKFRKYIKAGIALEGVYDKAAAAAGQFVKDEETLRPLLQKGGFSAENRLTITDLSRTAKEVFNPYVIPKADQDYQRLLGRLSAFVKKVDANAATIEDAAVLREIAERLKVPLSAPTPDFFALGSLSVMGEKTADAARDTAESVRRFEQGFLKDFSALLASALSASERITAQKRPEAIRQLDAAIDAFSEKMPSKRETAALIGSLSKTVKQALNPLDINRVSPAYTMEAALKMAAERYFEGQKNNPREEKRYARDLAVYEKNVKRGKIALKVKPTALIDTKAAHKSIVDMLRRVRADFAADGAQKTREGSAQMLAYLRLQSSERARRVSKAAARFKAIQLMEEVGIPEPRKRYRQYPFQFSGGMRQRVVIAIALSANPDILICDEPTTALDVTIQAQILELINDLKIKRRLSIIFITHDLGVVANMADRIGVMYAGKFVEYGTVDDLFYDPKHPYTWALLASMPDLDTKEKLAAIPGTPPNMILPPAGDAFAARNRYALQIDYEQQPPFFKVNDTHYAATWLLHEDAPKVEPPAIVTDRIRRMKTLKGN